MEDIGAPAGFESDSGYGKAFEDSPQFIADSFNRNYWRINPIIAPFWAEAYKDLQIYSGNQWDENEKKFLLSQKRNAFVYNKVFSVINAVVGYRARNPYGFQVNPVYSDDSTVANMYTDVLRHIFYQNNGYRIINEGIRSAAVTGISFLNCYPDFRDDPYSGNISLGLDYWNACVFDTFFTKRSMEDASFWARRKYITRDVAASLLPNKTEEIMNIPVGRRDSKFNWMPYARQWGMETLLAYTEYWQQKWKTAKVFVNRKTGETTPWVEGVISVKQILTQNPDLIIMERPVKVVTLSILVEDKVLFHKENPYGINRFPFVPIIGVFEPSNDLSAYRFQSLTRIVRDSQIEYNRRRSQDVDIAESQLNTGWIVKQDTLVNPSSLYQTGQGGVVTVKKNESINESLQKISPPPIPESYLAMEASLYSDIFQGLGVNPEILGRSENYGTEQSAILFKMRQESGLVPLEFFNDGIKESMKLFAELILDMAIHNYLPEKIQKITKKDSIPIEFYSSSMKEYGIVVEEGLAENTASSLPQLLMLKKEGISVPDEMIVKAMNLYEKEDLLNSLKESTQQQSQSQQQQMQMERESQQAVMESLHSKSLSDIATAQEKSMKAQAEVDYKMADIQRVRADAVGKLIKGVKDLTDTDFSRLMESLGIVQQLKDEERNESIIGKETLINLNENQPLPPPEQEIPRMSPSTQTSLEDNPADGDGISPVMGL